MRPGTTLRSPWWRRRQTAPIPSVQVLDLRPNDRLILEFPGKVTREMDEEIRAQAAEAFEVEKTRIVVVSNATVKVLREGEPPPPPVLLSPGWGR